MNLTVTFQNRLGVSDEHKKNKLSSIVNSQCEICIVSLHLLRFPQS